MSLCDDFVCSIIIVVFRGLISVVVSVWCSTQCLYVGVYTLSSSRPSLHYLSWQRPVVLVTAAPCGRVLWTLTWRRWSGICQSKCLRLIRCLCRVFHNCALRPPVYCDCLFTDWLVVGGRGWGRGDKSTVTVCSLIQSVNQENVKVA